jgi:hypothetical protein
MEKDFEGRVTIETVSNGYVVKVGEEPRAEENYQEQIFVAESLDSLLINLKLFLGAKI